MPCQWRSAISGAVLRKRSYLLLLHGGAGGRASSAWRNQTMEPNHQQPPFKSRTDWSSTAITFLSRALFFPPSSTPLFFLLRDLLHLFKRALTRTRPVSYNRSRREGSERWNSVSKLTSSQVSLRLRVKGDFWRNGKKIVMRFQMAVSLLTTLNYQGSLRSSFLKVLNKRQALYLPPFPLKPSPHQNVMKTLQIIFHPRIKIRKNIKLFISDHNNLLHCAIIFISV